MKTKKQDSTRPLLVPGNIEPVNAGVRTQAPELEVHLPGVLAGAGDRLRRWNFAIPVPPPIPHWHQDSTVSCGVNKISLVIHVCIAYAGINFLAVEDVGKLSFHLKITEIMNLVTWVII